MDTTKIEQLKRVKERFRALKPKERESLSISLLKINLGVNSADEKRHVEDFLEGLPLQLATGKLDAFMNYLHSASNLLPPEFSGFYSREDIIKDPPAAGKTAPSGPPPYNEDEVETLKDHVRPFPSRSR